jgi:hypothetical protein
MSLDKALKNLKFDVRMTEFNLKNGVISKEELNTHLGQLNDSAANSEKLDLEESSRSSSDNTQH